MKLRIWLLNILTPIQKIMSKLGNPEPKVSAHFTENIIKQLEDGDLLFSRENWKLTNLFVPGYWGHVATYRGGKIIEAVGSGVRQENVHRWFYQKDSIAVFRPILRKELRGCIGAVCLAEVGRPYDYHFIADNKAFYCSELYVWAYNQFVGLDQQLYFERRWGAETSTPQDLYDIADNNVFIKLGEERN